MSKALSNSVEHIGPSECWEDPEPVPKPLELDASEFSDDDLVRALAPILGKGRLLAGCRGDGSGMGQNSIMLIICWRPGIRKNK